MYRLRIFAQNLAIFLSVVIDIGAILAFICIDHLF